MSEKAEEYPIIRIPYGVLYHAVKDYVENKGGTVLAIEGVEVQVWPDDGRDAYHLAIKCKGELPGFAKPKRDT